jgi:hypothetical protein
LSRQPHFCRSSVNSRRWSEKPALPSESGRIAAWNFVLESWTSLSAVVLLPGSRLWSCW